MAIAFDNANSSKVTGASSITFSKTNTGSNLILAVGVAITDATLADRTVSGITYNAVALTKIRSDDDTTAPAGRSEMWYLVNPATGANNVVVTMGGTNTVLAAGAISLTGAAQTGQPDANNGAVGANNTPTVNVTTVADNSWVVDVIRVVTPTVSTAGAGQTERWEQNASDDDNHAAGSTEGPKTPAGSVTMSWTTEYKSWAISAASFSPAGEAPEVTPTPPRLYTLMGVGT